ncbi:alpha/beta-hydrolase [Trametes elegans]|nr:alpha/beta-hydrolase [Trametes elegans]
MLLAPSFAAALLSGALPLVRAAYHPSDVPSSWPQDYPGKPSGDFSPEWQDYFQVKDALPNVTWSAPRTFAGNIPVNRPGHPNNTLFFWAAEKQAGSLTSGASDNADTPWGIWLNGGPGASSMVGFTIENGPIHINANLSAQQNQYSWHQLSDYIWIDQPVGVGYSTADSAGYAQDEDQVGTDFMGFLTNLVKVFPSLQTRPLYLTGESYAGTYILYIMKAYFSMPNPPVKIVNVAIGNGAIGSTIVSSFLPVVSMLETYPQLIGYDQKAYEYFREQEHLCGYDLNLTYPQNGRFPTLHLVKPTSRSASSLSRRSRARKVIQQAKRAASEPGSGVDRRLERRDLRHRANGTIDPWYGCFLNQEMIDYATNFSLPWSTAHDSTNGFDAFDIPDALDPETNKDPFVFLNDSRTRAALHAPTSKNWHFTISYPWLGDPASDFNDPSSRPMAFLNELAANMSAQDISLVLFSGNDDAMTAHRSTEVVIQNTTFGGVQGFSRRPSTPWSDDDGQSAGVVHQERNWTYILIEDAGHLVPYTNPMRGFVVARDFIFGTNTTGLVSTGASGKVSVEGGETAALAVDAVRAHPGVFVGSAATQSTYAYPSATVAEWDAFIATATTGAGPGAGGATGKPGKHESGAASWARWRGWGSYAVGVPLGVIVVRLFL